MHRLWICFVAFCFATSYARADEGKASSMGEGHLYRHVHDGWSVSTFPLLCGLRGGDSESGSIDATEYGAAIRFDRALSNSLNLSTGLAISAGHENGEWRTSYLLDCGPTFLAPWSQHDRLFIGLGVALLGISESNERIDWGIGPRIALGMDYAVSSKFCLLLEGTAGFAHLGGKRYGGWESGYTSNIAGWARLLLGTRIGL